MSTFEEIDSNIQKWMSEETGWSFSKSDGPTYRRGYLLTTTNNNQIGVIIENIDRITIQKTFSLPSEIRLSLPLMFHTMNIEVINATYQDPSWRN